MNLLSIFRTLRNRIRKMMDPEYVDVEGLFRTVAPHKSTTWIPLAAESSSDPTASKFSGVPALAKGEKWPCCPNCREPMQLFLQLNSQHLPENSNQPFGEGFLQVFYCTNLEKNCETVCRADLPFSKSTLVRVVHYERDSIALHLKSPVKEPVPERVIESWEQRDDYPNWEELKLYDIHLSCEEFEEMAEQGLPQTLDKLLGWPAWLQGVQYPNCPECGKTMKLLFQIDSERNLDYMFGALGCAYVTHCEDHPTVVALQWANM